MQYIECVEDLVSMSAITQKLNDNPDGIYIRISNNQLTLNFNFHLPEYIDKIRNDLAFPATSGQVVQFFLEGVTINGSLNCFCDKSEKILYDFEFSNIKVNKEALFEGVNIKRIKCSQSDFENKFQFDNCDFLTDFKLLNKYAINQFKDNIHSSFENTNLGSLIFKECKIETQIKTPGIKASEFYLINSIVHDKFMLNGAVIETSVNIQGTIFKEKMDLSYGVLPKETHIQGVCFEEHARFNHIRGKNHESTELFLNSLSFSGNGLLTISCTSTVDWENELCINLDNLTLLDSKPVIQISDFPKSDRWSIRIDNEKLSPNSIRFSNMYIAENIKLNNPSDWKGIYFDSSCGWRKKTLPLPFSFFTSSELVKNIFRLNQLLIISGIALFSSLAFKNFLIILVFAISFILIVALYCIDSALKIDLSVIPNIPVNIDKKNLQHIYSAEYGRLKTIAQKNGNSQLSNEFYAWQMWWQLRFEGFMSWKTWYYLTSIFGISWLIPLILIVLVLVFVGVLYTSTLYIQTLQLEAKSFSLWNTFFSSFKMLRGLTDPFNFHIPLNNSLKPGLVFTFLISLFVMERIVLLYLLVQFGLAIRSRVKR